jgi:hypothetical protein
MLLAAMLGMALFALVPAFAQDGNVSQSCNATLTQSNTGSQYAINVASQDQNQGDQYVEPEVTVPETTEPVDPAGGGLQYQSQDLSQNATATGPTFNASQTQDCANAASVNAPVAAPVPVVTPAPVAAPAPAPVVLVSGGGSDASSGGASAGGGGATAGGAAVLPATGGPSVLLLVAGTLLVGTGLAARRFVR